MPRLALVLLFAAPVLAEDFETRYHEAYKLEVVDGKVADAAARYLDLLQAKDLPAHLRAQSEFRFAVTCALLGRPDEARARLASLAAAPDLPAALRPQIDEYRKALSDVAPGSAASKRMEELVFQLGREPATMSSVPGVYRDFEIMGTAAVPHLRRLLDHSDQQLREHAFRILCRMNEPGLVGLWDPEWASTVSDFATYLKANPASIPSLEARFKDAPGGNVDHILYRGSRLAWSAAFLRARAARTADPKYIAYAVALGQDREENRAILASWLADGPDAFASEAARIVASNLSSEEQRRNAFDPAQFPALCRRLARTEVGDREFQGLSAAAKEQPTAALLDLLAAVLGEENLAGRDRIAYVVGNALAARKTDDAESRRYAELLESWRAKTASEDLGGYVRSCAERLPADDAARLVGTFFAGRSKGSTQRTWTVARINRPEDVALFAAALESVDAGARSSFFNQVFYAADKRPETRLAMARLLPGLVDKIDAATLARWSRQLAPHLRPEETIPLLLELVRRDSASFWSLLPDENEGVDYPDDGVYRRDVLVPALPKLWEHIAESRGTAVRRSLRMLAEGGPRALGPERSRELAAFLLPRLGEMDYIEAKAGCAIVARYPELFPLETWLPGSPQSLWQTYPPFDGAIAQERLDGAARALVADPGKVTDTVVTFLSVCVSGDVAAECAAELYRKASPELLSMLVAQRLMPTDAGVLEETFERMKDADLAVVARLGFWLAEIRPSGKLFVLAERLLASPDRDFVLQGIELARSLGRDEMLQALLGKLDSMDSEVRTKAREAIDSILELKRIKDEVADRVKSRKLEEAGFK